LLTLNRRSLLLAAFGCSTAYGDRKLSRGSLWNITLNETVYVHSYVDESINDAWIHYTCPVEEESLWRVTRSWKSSFLHKTEYKDIHDEVSHQFWNHRKCYDMKKRCFGKFGFNFCGVGFNLVSIVPWIGKDRWEIMNNVVYKEYGGRT
jgi:hypothetical protein